LDWKTLNVNSWNEEVELRSLKKSFIDSGVLIWAARGDNELSEKAIQILDDPDREYASSIFVKLEVFPKAVYNKMQEEVEFYKAFFDAATHWVGASEEITNEALKYAETFGLGAMDALHYAAAISVGAEEFITTEKPSMPIHRVTNIKVITLYPGSSS